MGNSAKAETGAPPLELHVTSLGQFSICCPAYGPDVITEQESSSWRLWTFLQYLCTFHDKRVTQEEIIDVLWDDADITNPVNTLKTILHRSRVLLEKLGFPDGKQVLRYRRGVYSWDPELVIHMDIHAFDTLCARFSADPSGQEGLDAAREALALYQGDFLPNAAGSPWAVSPRTYYHARYLQLCVETATVLWKRGELEEAVDICRTATTLDPYDEPCQLLMMRLLHASGAKQTAIQYYSQVSNLLMDRLGVSPSEEMAALYRELTRSEETLEMDLRTVRTRLGGNEMAEGPLFCEYAVFQSIYHLMARSAPRTGQVVQLAMITLLDRDGERLTAERCSAAMEELRAAILSGLRSGDAFTRLSPAQYLLLLPRASHENGALAVERVLSAFQSTLSGMTTQVQFSLLPVLASGWPDAPIGRRGFATPSDRL